MGSCRWPGTIKRKFGLQKPGGKIGTLGDGDKYEFVYDAYQAGKDVQLNKAMAAADVTKQLLPTASTEPVGAVSDERNESS
jgi:hypothetical protein